MRRSGRQWDLFVPRAGWSWFCCASNHIHSVTTCNTFVARSQAAACLHRGVARIDGAAEGRLNLQSELASAARWPLEPASDLCGDSQGHLCQHGASGNTRQGSPSIYTCAGGPSGMARYQRKQMHNITAGASNAVIQARDGQCQDHTAYMHSIPHVSSIKLLV